MSRRTSTCSTATSTPAIPIRRTPGCARTRRCTGTPPTSCGASPATTTSSRSRSDKDVFISSDQDKGGYRPNMPADPAIIGLDDPAAPQAAQPRVPPLHAPGRLRLGGRTSAPRSTELLDAVEAKGGQAEIVGRAGRAAAGDDDRPAARLRRGAVARAQGLVRADHRPRRRTPLLQRGRDGRGDGVRPGRVRALRGQDNVPGRRRDVDLDARRRSTVAAVGRRRSSPTACCCWTAAPRRPAPSSPARSLNLIAHPAQWRTAQAGADLAVATEEFIRYVTPIHNMCRVAAVDAEVDGVHGSRRAAGRADVRLGQPGRRPFADPERFDVTRQPNNHIAFGFGTHFCLGAALARLEIRVFFEELVRRVAGMAAGAGHRAGRDAQRLRLRPALGPGRLRVRLNDARASAGNRHGRKPGYTIWTATS